MATRKKRADKTVYAASAPFKCTKCKWTHGVTVASAAIHVCCFCHKTQFTSCIKDFHASTSTAAVAAGGKAIDAIVAPQKTPGGDSSYKGADVRRKANNNGGGKGGMPKKGGITTGTSYADAAKHAIAVVNDLSKLGVSAEVLDAVKNQTEAHFNANKPADPILPDERLLVSITDKLKSCSKEIEKSQNYLKQCYDNLQQAADALAAAKDKEASFKLQLVEVRAKIGAGATAPVTVQPAVSLQDAKYCVATFISSFMSSAPGAITDQVLNMMNEHATTFKADSSAQAAVVTPVVEAAPTPIEVLPVYNVPVTNRFGGFDVDNNDHDPDLALDIIDEVVPIVPTKHTQYAVPTSAPSAAMPVAALVTDDGRANEVIADALMGAKALLGETGLVDDSKRRKVETVGEAEQLG
jgi:hypothetical protein